MIYKALGKQTTHETGMGEKSSQENDRQSLGFGRAKPFSFQTLHFIGKEKIEEIQDPSRQNQKTYL